MGFLFEVAQVEALGWKPRSSDWRGIYLEVYVEKANKRKIKCCCRRKNTNKQRKAQTAIEDEARTMRWRVLKKEGFLQALFVLGDERKRRRKGDQLIITADVMTVTEMGRQERGEHVATYKGTLQVGTWGPVLLFDDSKDSKDADETAQFILETRPISARPFKLENARPWDEKGSLAMIMRKARFGRRLSMQSPKGGDKLSKKKGVEEDRSMSKKSRKSNWSVGSLLAASRRHQDGDSETSDTFPEDTAKGSAMAGEGDDAWTIDLKPLTRLKMEERGNGHSVSSMSLAHFSKEDAARQSGGYPKEDDDSVLDNQMSFTSRNSNQIRNLLDKFFESESETLEPAKRNNGKHWLLQRKNITTTSLLGVPLEECNREWKPTEWQIMWHCGKADTSSKAEGYDVVPLMEAEFRRDCVVFYNTLFPNIDSGAFQMLREMALSGDGDQRGLRKAGLRAVDVTRKSDFRKSEQDSPAGGWVGRVLSRVSQRRSMGRMVSVFTSVASSRDRPSEGSPKDHEAEDLELGDLDVKEAPEPQEAQEGGQSATSSTNSNSLRGGQGQNSDSDTTSSRGQDDQLYCLKLDMLDNMEQARYVVMPPRAPATGRKSHSDEEGSEDFADLPDEEHVEVGSNQKGRRSTRGDWLQGVETEEEAAEAKDDIRNSQELKDRPRLPRRNSNASVYSVAESLTLFRARATPLLAKLPNGQVCSSVMHDQVAQEVLESGAELFIDDYSPRIMFLKRLLVCYALCGVYYSEAGNTEQLGDPWPYPVASVLGHGSRVLIRLEDVESSEFLNYLLTGDPHIVDWKESRPPIPLQKRIAATHSVELKETGQIVEKKLRVTNAGSNMQNLLDGIRGKHMGLNLPIGGAGNPSPLGPHCMVGLRGDVLSRRKEEDRSLISRLWGFKKSEDNTVFNSESSNDSRPSQEAQEWKLERRVQGGHLYIRTDDFGMVTCSRSSGAVTAEDEQSIFKTDKDSAHERLAKARQQVELRNDVMAGDLIFPQHVPQLNTRKVRTAARRHLGQFSLLRVSSELSLGESVAEGTAEDILWFGQALVARQNTPLALPPSAAALKMLIEHYDPINAQLYGTGNFKSIEAFRKELSSGASLLARSHKGGLQRFCQPVILQLRFRGCVLMKMGECREHSEEYVSKPAFAVISAGLTEHWRSAVMRIFQSELCIRHSIIEALTPAASREKDCLTVLTETTMSPSYPGMPSVYRTHMVCWEVDPEQLSVLESNGLTFPEGETLSASSSSGLPFGCHFVTHRNGTGKKIFWRWVPFFEAQKLQRFVNLGEATADERWARYAFQKEGVVQFPPTETALMILLRRCGIDVAKFGTERYKSLREFWLDLTGKESLLQMSKGKPLRLADSTVVRLRWRPPGERAFQVLVKEILNGNGRRKLLTRRMLHGETWEESALHCIEEDLAMKPNHGKYLLGQRSFDKSSYTFLQELTESDRYPGIKCCYRTHLVSYIVKEELGAIVTQRREGFPEEPTLLQGLLPETLTGTSPTSDNRDSRDGQGREKLQIPQPSYTSPRTRAESGSEMIASPTSATVTAERTTVTKQRLSLKSLPNFVWLPENMLQGVKGGDLWEQAQKHQEQHRVCSVLLGLEGTAPQMKSPFGVEHDGSGKSAPISALGNYKWSTYRSNNALQVPADHGGLRMNITKAMFEELRRTCEKMDLLHPSLDLTLEPKAPRGRELLEQRFAEREIFKRILSSNAADARSVIEWMDEYRSINKTFRMKVEAVTGPSHESPVAQVMRRDRILSEMSEYVG